MYDNQQYNRRFMNSKNATSEFISTHYRGYSRETIDPQPYEKKSMCFSVDRL